MKSTQFNLPGGRGHSALVGGGPLGSIAPGGGPLIPTIWGPLGGYKNYNVHIQIPSSKSIDTNGYNNEHHGNLIRHKHSTIHFFQMTIYCTNVKLKAIRVKQPQKTQFAPTIPGGGGPTASLGGAIVMAIGGWPGWVWTNIGGPVGGGGRLWPTTDPHHQPVALSIFIA